MTEQLIFFTVRNAAVLDVIYFRLRMIECEEMTIFPITKLSRLIRITHDWEHKIPVSKLLWGMGPDRVRMAEMDPEEVEGWMRYRARPKKKDRKPQPVKRPRPGHAAITQCQVDRVLDHIGKIGLEGIRPFERRILDRYAEQLCRSGAGTKPASNGQG